MINYYSYISFLSLALFLVFYHSLSCWNMGNMMQSLGFFIQSCAVLLSLGARLLMTHWVIFIQEYDWFLVGIFFNLTKWEPAYFKEGVNKTPSHIQQAEVDAKICCLFTSYQPFRHYLVFIADFLVHTMQFSLGLINNTRWQMCDMK